MGAMRMKHGEMQNSKVSSSSHRRVIKLKLIAITYCNNN